MERKDEVDELVNDVYALVRLDEYNHAESKQYVSLYFFLLCLQKELKKNFIFEGVLLLHKILEDIRFFSNIF